MTMAYTRILNRFALIFFFSSRRRHTRDWRDWSSDVCSSDLAADHLGDAGREPAAGLVPDVERARHLLDHARRVRNGGEIRQAIGRALCRERVVISVVGVSLKKKNTDSPNPRVHSVQQRMFY